MSDRHFVDTNVLIYAYDVDAGQKHLVATETLRRLWTERAGILSLQVLQEFYVNVTRKISKPLSKASARSVIETYEPWSVSATFADVSAAFRIEDASQIRFWDALIVATAARAGATTILTEDLNHGQSISGIRIVNPFAKTP